MKHPSIIWGRWFRICSSQSSGPRKWAVCLVDQSTTAARIWRATDKRGRVRLFASREAAGRFVAELEAEHLASLPWRLKLAQYVLCDQRRRSRVFAALGCRKDASAYRNGTLHCLAACKRIRIEMREARP